MAVSYASVLIHCIIDRLACWAKVNAQQRSHLSLNFSLLLWNLTLCSHGICHYCCVYSVCCVLQINLQFWVFTVNTASLMNGRSHAQHYSFSEEWLEELSKAKGSNARPISDLRLFWALPLTPLHLQNYCCLGILHELQIKAAEPSLKFLKERCSGLYLSMWLYLEYYELFSFAANGMWRAAGHSLAFSSKSPKFPFQLWIKNCDLTPNFIPS